MQDMLHVIEAAIEKNLPQSGLTATRTLDEAIRYAVLSGGKRIRPVLSLLGARIVGGDLRKALPAACAVEYVHTSSLLFDDLPCMDDAHLRRGVPTLHVRYGEDVAVLVALALLNQAYALFGARPEMVREAVACIGVEGMIGGQAFDLTPDEPAPLDAAERATRLRDRNRKTSAMMRLALTAGALACGASPEEVEPLGRAGLAFGEAFQMGDDLLDARRSDTHTGKTAGQDLRHQRPSHGELDEAECLQRMQQLVAGAQAELTAAYGAERIQELMQFAEAMFRKLTEAERPAARETSEAATAVEP